MNTPASYSQSEVDRLFVKPLERELSAANERNEQLTQQLNALRLVCGTTDANKFQTALDRANERIAALEADRERLSKHADRLTAERDAWKAAYEADANYQRQLRADRDRLDWLNLHAAFEKKDGRAHYSFSAPIECAPWNPRTAIDAAIALGGEG